MSNILIPVVSVKTETDGYRDADAGVGHRAS
jgi:hypothetical protein